MLRFEDAATEAAFDGDQARKAVRPVRIALAVLSTLALAFYVAMVHVFPGTFVGIGNEPMLRATIGLVGTCAVVYLITFRPVFLRRQQLVMALLACVLWTGFIRSAGLSPPAVLDARGYTMPLLFTFYIYGAFRLRIVAASLAGWFGAAIFLAYMGSTGLMSAAGLGRSAMLLAGANLGGMLICWQVESAARREFMAMRMLDEERARAERLLLNILPESIAKRLKASEQSIAEHADGVTVLFADIVGFTPLSARKTPHELVALLNRIFTGFDALAAAHGLEKIKTVGDAYMAVAGLPQPAGDHAARAARMALAMHECVARLAGETGEALALRIGLHSGPVVAGVIGSRKFAYDLWGDTVNTASRMESHGLPGETHCTRATAALLQAPFRVDARGPVEIKGKGEMQTFWLRPAAA